MMLQYFNVITPSGCAARGPVPGRVCLPSWHASCALVAFLLLLRCSLLVPAQWPFILCSLFSHPQGTAILPHLGPRGLSDPAANAEPQRWPRARPPPPAPCSDGSGHSLRPSLLLTVQGLDAGAGWGAAVPRLSRLSPELSTTFPSIFGGLFLHLKNRPEPGDCSVTTST